MSTPEYVEFSRTERGDGAGLKKRVCGLLGSSPRAPLLPWLREFQQRGYASGFTGPDGLLLVCLTAAHDAVLMSMARVRAGTDEVPFPRGFFVVVDTTTADWRLVCATGFRPKFDNDTRDPGVEGALVRDMKKSDRLVITPKFSGHLGGVLWWPAGGRLQYTAVSKKNADSTSPFVENVRRLLAQPLARHLADLRRSGLSSAWAEVMACNDQVHGARVTDERAIITALSGDVLDAACRPTVGGVEVARALRRLGGDLDRHAVPSAEIAGDRPRVSAVLDALVESRDFADYDAGLAALRAHGLELSHPETHPTVAGQCLEGWVIYNDRGMVKLKCAAYTCRTMFLRTAIDADVADGAVDWARSIEAYVQRWVAADARPRYRRYCLQLARAYLAGHRYQTARNGVGTHILAAEEVGLPRPDATEELDAAQLEAEDRRLRAAFPSEKQARLVIVVTGPVACGKSTVADQLAARLVQAGVPTVHVDGDRLLPELGERSEEYTVSLSSERNPWTAFSIARALARHHVAVVSAGGGVFSNNLLRSVGRLLDAPIQLHVMAPVPSTDARVVDRSPLDPDVREAVRGLYADTASTIARIQRRVETGGSWASLDPGAVSGIAAASCRNYEFLTSGKGAPAPLERPWQWYLYPHDPTLPAIDFAVVVRAVAGFQASCAPFEAITRLHYGQRRRLVVVEGQPPVGRHVTLEFCPADPGVVGVDELATGVHRAAATAWCSAAPTVNRKGKHPSDFFSVVPVGHLADADGRLLFRHESPHVTLAPLTRHDQVRPVAMGAATKAIDEQQAAFRLPAANGGAYDYRLSDGVRTPVDLLVLGEYVA